MSDFTKADRRPWKLASPDDTTITGADNDVAEMLGDYDNYDDFPRMEANAALIVAAVNGYDAAQARIAELEKALRLVLEQRDLSIQGRLHPMGELEIIALARATLAQEPQP